MARVAPEEMVIRFDEQQMAELRRMFDPTFSPDVPEGADMHELLAMVRKLRQQMISVESDIQEVRGRLRRANIGTAFPDSET